MGAVAYTSFGSDRDFYLAERETEQSEISSDPDEEREEIREIYATKTWIEGTFVREFIQSPAGSLPPNGQRVVWDLLNIFRFDDQGRLAEEWVRTDYRSFIRQLGAQGK